jgi:hypothetical protein
MFSDYFYLLVLLFIDHFLRYKITAFFNSLVLGVIPASLKNQEEKPNGSSS